MDSRNILEKLKNISLAKKVDEDTHSVKKSTYIKPPRKQGVTSRQGRKAERLADAALNRQRNRFNIVEATVAVAKSVADAAVNTAIKTRSVSKKLYQYCNDNTPAEVWDDVCSFVKGWFVEPVEDDENELSNAFTPNVEELSVSEDEIVAKKLSPVKYFFLAIWNNLTQFVLYDIGNYVDYVITYFRTDEVYSNVSENDTNSDSESNNSWFNWLFKRHGENSALSVAGIVAFTISIGSILIGPFVKFWSWCHEEYDASLGNFVNRLRAEKIVPEDMSDEDIESDYIRPTYIRLLKRHKVLGLADALKRRLKRALKAKALKGKVFVYNTAEIVDDALKGMGDIDAGLKLTIKNGLKAAIDQALIDAQERAEKLMQESEVARAEGLTIADVVDVDNVIDFAIAAVPVVEVAKPASLENYNRETIEEKAFKDKLKKEYESDWFAKFALAIAVLDSENDIFSMGLFNDNPEDKTAVKWKHLTVWQQAESMYATVRLFFKAIYDAVNDNGFSFWLTWFPFVMVFGITAASSIFLLPLIVSISLGLWLTLTMIKVGKIMYDGYKKHHSTKQEIEKTKQDDADKEANAKLDAKIRHRTFMKLQHKKYMQDLAEKTDIELAYNKENGISEEEQDDVEKDDIEKDEQDCPARPAPRYFNISREEIENSTIGKRLLDGSREMYVWSTIAEFVNAIVTISFAFWIIYSVIIAYGVFIPGIAIAKTALAVFFGSSINAGGVGFAFAAVFAFMNIGKVKRDNIKHEENIVDVWSQEYKNTGISRFDYFNQHEPAVAFGMARGELSRLRFISQCSDDPELADFIKKFNLAQFDKTISVADYQKQYKELSDKRKKCEATLRSKPGAIDADLLDAALKSDYDLDAIDVYNLKNHEKLRDTPDKLTTFEKIAHGIHTFLAGMQTGSLLARTLFLKDCILSCLMNYPGHVAAGVSSLVALGVVGHVATAAVFTTFITVAVICAVGYAIVRYMQDRVTLQRREQEAMLDNADEMNSYLWKKEKELNVLNEGIERRIDIISKYKNVDAEKKEAVNDKVIDNDLIITSSPRVKSEQKYYDKPYSPLWEQTASSQEETKSVNHALDDNQDYGSNMRTYEINLI